MFLVVIVVMITLNQRPLFIYLMMMMKKSIIILLMMVIEDREMEIIIVLIRLLRLRERFVIVVVFVAIQQIVGVLDAKQFVTGQSGSSACTITFVVAWTSLQHWRAGHKLECKEDSSRTSCNERKPSVYMDTICSYQQSRKDEASVEEKGPSERNLVEELKIVEECPICISRIRLSKQSRPSVSCDTCKHKFHLSCISKWFSISKNSICPLCGCKFKPGGLLQLTAAKKS
ncbi:hypothetical protein C5167_012838 [Papaver somniferum]|uniref:E3 ubiquitin-protein ligase listerin n=1 Tax=Papaver somniferum TaxID=3469 RepID=A0A4Y7J1Q2_PAPSO|nr:hypothetical protein C5167_012838 [Papaver somniferum]